MQCVDRGDAGGIYRLLVQSVGRFVHGLVLRIDEQSATRYVAFDIARCEAEAHGKLRKGGKLTGEWERNCGTARGKAFYDKECGDKTAQVYDPCTPVKGEDVVVDIDEAVRTVRFALERLGYPMKPWFKYARKSARS